MPLTPSSQRQRNVPNARIATRRSPYRRRRRNRNRRLQSREPAPGSTLVRAGRARGLAPAVRSPATPRRGSRGEDRIEQLKDLASLKEQGALTDEEFASRKGAHPRRVSGVAATAPTWPLVSGFGPGADFEGRLAETRSRRAWKRGGQGPLASKMLTWGLAIGTG